MSSGIFVLSPTEMKVTKVYDLLEKYKMTEIIRQGELIPNTADEIAFLQGAMRYQFFIREVPVIAQKEIARLLKNAEKEIKEAGF